ncbi:hypothetical protein E2C01_020128 [Portunus trituberculatus]|uniref:Uncharacterized protein n=1 Tax=Portunus trituberculatus TaxID=210409 RepID=A0A5B7E0G9_PORTR|nr:hypothetical protein [Portunus trituberculatus]
MTPSPLPPASPNHYAGGPQVFGTGVGASLTPRRQDTSNSSCGKIGMVSSSMSQIYICYSLHFLQLLHYIVDQTLPGRASVMCDNTGCEDGSVGHVTVG